MDGRVAVCACPPLVVPALLALKTVIVSMSAQLGSAACPPGCGGQAARNFEVALTGVPGAGQVRAVPMGSLRGPKLHPGVFIKTLGLPAEYRGGVLLIKDTSTDPVAVRRYNAVLSMPLVGALPQFMGFWPPAAFTPAGTRPPPIPLRSLHDTRDTPAPSSHSKLYSNGVATHACPRACVHCTSCVNVHIACIFLGPGSSKAWDVATVQAFPATIKKIFS